MMSFEAELIAKYRGVRARLNPPPLPPEPKKKRPKRRPKLPYAGERMAMAIVAARSRIDGVCVADIILYGRRFDKIVKARHAAMARVNQKMDWSIAQIADFFSVDGASVRYALKKAGAK